MQWKVFWILLVAIVLVAALIPLVKYLQIESCHDAGGRWNYGKSQCEGARK